jgi:hypothetical protein
MVNLNGIFSQAYLQVFDLASRSVLRQFKMHKRPTHTAHFSPNKTQLLSGSDDATARLWDLAQGEQITRMAGHADYVRCAAPASDVLWVTGSYDHSVKLWDVRTKTAVMTLEHGAPVESVTVFLASRMAASGGGTAVALWDIVGGGRLLRRLTNHQKTVMSVSVVDVKDREGRESVRLLSSSLDGHVKVYDLDTFKVAYAYKYPAPVMAAAVSPNLGSMAVGMADRTLVVRKHRQAHGALTSVGVLTLRVRLCLRARGLRLKRYLQAQLWMHCSWECKWAMLFGVSSGCRKLKCCRHRPWHTTCAPHCRDLRLLRKPRPLAKHLRLRSCMGT